MLDDLAARLERTLNAHLTGGHIGYYENPEAVIHDLRTMFRPLR